MSRPCPRLFSTSLFFSGLLSFAAAAGAAAAEPAAGPSSNPPVAHSLERADLEPWLDGFMPYAIERGDVREGLWARRRGEAQAGGRGTHDVSARLDFQAIYLDSRHAARGAGQAG